MRKALTLIELIFTMVIVAIVFTVIPKLIQSTSTASGVVIKEDGIYASMTMMGKIINQAWDEENTKTNAILNTHESNCTKDRKYLFLGGRSCKGEEENTYYNASTIGVDTGNDLNDIDDFNEKDINAKLKCGTNSKNLYDLGVKVSYIENPNKTEAYPKSTDFKLIQITTKYSPTVHGDSKNHCVALEFVSYNIGLASIKRRRWK